jgi:hypothetical protein
MTEYTNALTLSSNAALMKEKGKSEYNHREWARGVCAVWGVGLRLMRLALAKMLHCVAYKSRPKVELSRRDEETPHNGAGFRTKYHLLIARRSRHELLGKLAGAFDTVLARIRTAYCAGPTRAANVTRVEILSTL